MRNERKIINLVKDYSSSPYGRYSSEVQQDEEDTTGENFRKNFLIPALEQYKQVHVDLTGYNRYARSFIDEAFGGLISSGEYSLSDLQGRLTYEHKDLPSIEALIDDRMKFAEKKRNEA